MSSLFSIGEDELDLDDEVRLICAIFLIIHANKFLRFAFFVSREDQN